MAGEKPTFEQVGHLCGSSHPQVHDPDQEIKDELSPSAIHGGPTGGPADRGLTLPSVTQDVREDADVHGRVGGDIVSC